MEIVGKVLERVMTVEFWTSAGIAALLLLTVIGLVTVFTVIMSFCSPGSKSAEIEITATATATAKPEFVEVTVTSKSDLIKEPVVGESITKPQMPATPLPAATAQSIVLATSTKSVATVVDIKLIPLAVNKTTLRRYTDCLLQESSLLEWTFSGKIPNPQGGNVEFRHFTPDLSWLEIIRLTCDSLRPSDRHSDTTEMRTCAVNRAIDLWHNNPRFIETDSSSSSKYTRQLIGLVAYETCRP